jgi:hypothetical protein
MRIPMDRAYKEKLFAQNLSLLQTHLPAYH